MPDYEFGKIFLDNYNRAKREQRQQEQFQKQMDFKERQMGLMDAVRQQRLAQQATRNERLTEQQQLENMLMLREVPEGTPGAVQGRSLLDFGSGGDFQPLPEGAVDPNKSYLYGQKPQGETRNYIDSYKSGYTVEGEDGLPKFVPFKNRQKSDVSKDVNKLYGNVKQGVRKVRSLIKNPVDKYGFELSPEAQESQVDEAKAEYIDDADRLVRSLGLVNFVDTIEQKLQEKDSTRNALSGVDRDKVINTMLEANDIPKREKEAIKLYFELTRPEISSKLWENKKK